jgi:hypothetical protein
LGRSLGGDYGDNAHNVANVFLGATVMIDPVPAYIGLGLGTYGDGRQLAANFADPSVLLDPVAVDRRRHRARAAHAVPVVPAWVHAPIHRTNRRGNLWTGSSFRSGDIEIFDAYGPRGESRHCRSYQLSFSAYTQCG